MFLLPVDTSVVNLNVFSWFERRNLSGAMQMEKQTDVSVWLRVNAACLDVYVDGIQGRSRRKGIRAAFDETRLLSSANGETTRCQRGWLEPRPSAIWDVSKVLAYTLVVLTWWATSETVWPTPGTRPDRWADPGWEGAGRSAIYETGTSGVSARIIHHHHFQESVLNAQTSGSAG